MAQRKRLLSPDRSLGNRSWSESKLHASVTATGDRHVLINSGELIIYQRSVIMMMVNVIGYVQFHDAFASIITRSSAIAE